jgi:hypothetical protein
MHVKNIPKNAILCQFRADAQKYGHRPQYKAENDAAEIEACAKKCHVSAA